MSLRIAVVSDLHCHPKKDGTTGQNRTHFFSDGARARGNRHPIQYLVDLIDRDPTLRASVLALPGDISDQASYHGYVVGVHSIRELAAKLGAATVAATIGNHDVDSRGQFGKEPFYCVKEMFTDFPIKSPTEFNSFFTQGFAFIEHPQFRILLLNSVLSHTSKEAAESGKATPVQVAALRERLKLLPERNLQLCVVHHHVIPHEDLNLGAQDLLVGGEEIVRLLEEHRFSLIIHGHKHHPRLRYSTVGQLPIFAAGSLSAAIDPITGSACRNTFHIVELFEPSESVPYPHGRIDSWDLKLDSGWERTSRASSSFPGTAGFGCHVDPGLLAKRVDDVFRAGGSPWMLWKDILSKLPELAYLAPTHLERLGNVLQRSHKLKFGGDFAEPIMVGKETSS